MSTRSYAILGTGAIGGFYGAKLQQLGIDVHFLLHSDYQQVCRQGLSIESPTGSFTLFPVQAYDNSHKMPACDVVIVALKTTQNHLLPQILPPLVKEDGVVLILQNGLGIEPLVAEIVNAKRVIGGLCFICSNKVGKGHIRHLDYGMITMGEYNENYQPGGITTRIKQIAEDFNNAGIPVELSENLLLARWKKLVWNIPYNGLSVVLNAKTDELMNAPDSRILVEEIMREVVKGAQGYDCMIPEEFIQKMLNHTEKMTPYLTSMKLDYDSKRPLEIEAIIGNPWRMATEKGVDLPYIEMLYRQLKFLDYQNRLV
ncbi:putative 2-dehydropantoate 2-reductase [Limnoraphis robusta Tam1]|uniref:2-dehydropantoate 2-reductase n=1 Tax=Limnoraphis robusta CCNP1315 TaxID=3110306 RepID=A0ABU5TS43_9CYAN|nr:putative 2-dehydropantoate 2-reductase [Limnoraphis robusta]MEA5496877.1 putative 2-dehydropantoate 2-reductase [Limnoraphis robusta BA-68 BA1]MEA5517530.1 putative 2-dehydropantoate 2-reductase [Limnoraphis robusta CCNP1315]MEA5541275.1 putative 2-dehydropantoate 2-reductase [Limnoraphis robusta Tam1]MEA5544668.1 putative 2-dehydropantoate 2-reductase [Limnoraphis robusta CCNP1324]